MQNIGSWKNKFSEQATVKEAPFFTLDGEEKHCERMNTRANMQYAEFSSIQARAVRLPFEQ